MQTKSLIERHLAEAESALAALDKQRDDLLAEIVALREVVSKRSPNGVADPQPEAVPKPDEPGEARYGSKRWRYENAIEELLNESGTMHRLHLLTHMKTKGIIGDERDPLANISNILSTSPKFVPVGSGIWGLAAEMEDEEETTSEKETAG